MVLRNSIFEIVRVTGVIAAITAPKNVDPETHEAAFVRMPFDKLRANGFEAFCFIPAP